MKLLAMALLGLSVVMACEDPPVVEPRDEDTKPSPSQPDPDGIEVCSPFDLGAQCSQMPSQTGQCAELVFKGESHESCLDGHVDGLMHITSCFCGDCVKLTYVLLAGGESPAEGSDYLDREHYHMFVCPEGVEEQ